MSDIINKLMDLFVQFPTVGPRTARRFVFYLTSLPKEKISELISALQDLKNQVRLCLFCFQPFQALTDQKVCHICSHPSRNKSILCIVEKETDLITIENTKKYNGLYFILGGVISLKTEINTLRLKQLKERLANPEKFGLNERADFSEIIIALNPTPEGKIKNILVERTIKEISPSLKFKITRLARGLPIGGELEYADEETLESAFEGRK